MNEAPPDARPLLLLVGSGRNAHYRGWSLQSVSQQFRLWLLSRRPATWELPYIVGQSLVEALEPGAALEAALRLSERLPITGVLCYDEMRIIAAARLAEALHLPIASEIAIRACRDKYRMRQQMGQVKSIPVANVESAREAADEIGYPVILKPRSLAASEGVVKVDHPGALAAAFLFAQAAHASFPELRVEDRGVLVEEYLDGPEITVDSVVWRGEVRPAFISHKRQDILPTFEETGHLVVAEDPLLGDARLLEMVQTAHSAAGFDNGVTHTEVRLTPGGPRLVELNARLGGDLITYVGLLATGIDLALAAATIAAGNLPDITPCRRGAAAVRYLYPPCDMILDEVRIAVEKLPREIWMAKALAQRGAVLRRPPRSFVAGRAALGFVVAVDAQSCERAALALSSAVEIRGTPVPEG